MVTSSDECKMIELKVKPTSNKQMYKFMYRVPFEVYHRRRKCSESMNRKKKLILCFQKSLCVLHISIFNMFFTGPKQNTVSDFWLMAWQENVTQVVMLTNLKEGRKVCQN